MELVLPIPLQLSSPFPASFGQKIYACCKYGSQILLDWMRNKRYTMLILYEICERVEACAHEEVTNRGT